MKWTAPNFPLLENCCPALTSYNMWGPEKWEAVRRNFPFINLYLNKFPTSVANVSLFSSLPHSSGTKMDQEPHGQCGQTSEPQPEVHWPFWGAPPSWGTRLWARPVSIMPEWPRFPKGHAPAWGVLFLGNPTWVWSKFFILLRVCSEKTGNFSLAFAPEVPFFLKKCIFIMLVRRT